MAIQTATSTSSTADSTPSTTTSSTNSTTTTNNSNPNDLGRNSIPFSFLVAFLALFVAFMGIGLFAKRLIYFIRLRLGLPIPEPNARRKVPKAKKEKPVLWDVYPEKRNTSEEGDGRWRNIKPLSCYFLRDVPQSDTSPSTSSPTTSPNPPTSPSYTRTTHTRSHTLLPQAFVGTGRMAIAPLPPPPPPRPLFYSPDSNSIRSRPRMTSARTRTPPNPIQDLITNIRELLHPTTAPARSHALEKKPRTSHEGNKDEEKEGVRVAVLIAMPSEESHRRRLTEGKAGHDRTSKASTDSSSSSSFKSKLADVEVDVKEGGGGLETLGEMSVGISDVPLEWAEVDGWEEDGEEDEKT